MKRFFAFFLLLALIGPFFLTGCDMGTYDARFQEKLKKSVVGETFAEPEVEENAE